MSPRLLLALALVVPSLASAHILRWTDATGHLHYANRAADAPAYADVVRRDIGYLAAERHPVPRAEVAARKAPDGECRAIRNRLGEIDDFGRYFRARQVVRLLQRYPESYIMPDFLVGDQWLRLTADQAWLLDALRQIDARRRGQG